MFNQRFISFIGIDRNNLFPKLLIEGFQPLSIVLPQENEEAVAVLAARYVFHATRNFRKPCQPRRCMSSMAGKDVFVLRNDERFADTILPDGFGQSDNVGIVVPNGAIEFFILRGGKNS